MPTTFSPTPQKVTVSGQTYNLVAFYYPDHDTDWDLNYGCGFLGNFYPCSQSVTITRRDADGNGVTASFHISEAAFQSLKWWHHDNVRAAFEKCVTGDDAYRLSVGKGSIQPMPPADLTYTGLDRKGAMLEVVTAKFMQNLHLKQALLDTGDAYLLEHPDRGPDQYWSDGRRQADGKFHGENWLGQTLMTVRQNLGGKGAPAGTTPKDKSDNIAMVNAFANAVIEQRMNAGA